MFPGEFTQDKDIDIDNTSSNYFDHRGAAVRIRVIWTRPIYMRRDLLAHSLQLIRAADEILKRYTLRLDVEPLGAAAPAIHVRERKRIHDALEPERRDAVKEKGASGFVSRTAVVTKEFLQTTAKDQELDDTDMVQKGQVPFNEVLTIPYEGGLPSIEQFKPLRQQIEPIAHENRLIVAFASMSGGPDGFVALYPDWLPWVLVDPRNFGDQMTLIHEIGHACRLAHQQENVPAQKTQADSMHYRNIMSYYAWRNQLWGWQVEAIYNSYWCEGRRPKNWWDRTWQATLPPDHPFLWKED